MEAQIAGALIGGGIMVIVHVVIAVFYYGRMSAKVDGLCRETERVRELADKDKAEAKEGIEKAERKAREDVARVEKSIQEVSTRTERSLGKVEQIVDRVEKRVETIEKNLSRIEKQTVHTSRGEDKP